MGSSWKVRRVRELTQRGRDKRRRLRRRFDLIVLALGGLVAVAAFFCKGNPVDLTGAGAYGFAHWFLLFPAYLPLEVIEFFNWCFKLDHTAVMRFIFAGDQGLALGAIDLAMLAVVWAAIRFAGVRRFGERILEPSFNFVLIVFLWGCFQMACVWWVTVWPHDGAQSRIRTESGAATSPKGM
ncbi:MAG: hypothetical protein PHI35_06850 [Victivallaceae bacterium]|nr:hypothetical protein [Victivallaceae bacterium]